MHYRWRLEDKPWRIVCVNRTDGSVRDIDRSVSAPLRTLSDADPASKSLDNPETGGWARHAASATPEAAWELPHRAVCHDPDEYKVVLGQGWPPIPSRFKDPRDPKNNAWRPSSVPAVQAQPWWYNYRNGACGVRKLDDDLDEDDPLLERGYPNTTASGRRECTDIMDNPLHGTPADLLVGKLAVVETRRAKYVAVSKLTDDYLDTSSLLRSFEGELEDERDMVALLTSFGNQFGWTPRGAKVGSSTFHPPVDSSAQLPPDTSTAAGEEEEEQQQQQDKAAATDVHTPVGHRAGAFGMTSDHPIRLHQYEREYGDRAEFSLACVLDGTCGVNFADQVNTEANEPSRYDEAYGEYDLFSGSPTSGSQDFRSSFTG